MATISPSDQAVELMNNLSLDQEGAKTQVPETVTKDLYGATKCGKPNVLPNGVNKASFNQKKLGYQNYNQKGSYGKSTYPYWPYQYPRYGYDLSYGTGKGSSLNYPYLNTQQGKSGSNGMDQSYMDMYAMYYMSALGYGYDYYGYDMYKQTSNWYSFNNGYKTRNYGYYGYGKENVEGLNELNRGPRSAKSYKIDEKKTENVSDASLPDSKEYNKEDFVETYAKAKIFVIKSYSEDDIHKSIKYSVWSSTPNGNKKLNAAYNEDKESPVFLLFSVNTSGQFVGLAEMVGSVDFNKTVEYWQQDKWIGCFPVKWHIVKDIPNSFLRHITLENNENKPVTNSRDTQEVKVEEGNKVIKVFKEHVSKTSILDDFAFYESREKIIQERKKKHQQFKKQQQGLVYNDKKVKAEEVKEGGIITSVSPPQVGNGGIEEISSSVALQNGVGEVASAC